MKSFFHYPLVPLRMAAVVVITGLAFGGSAVAQSKKKNARSKKAPVKAAAAAGTVGAATAASGEKKEPGTASKYEQHLAANLKLLKVLSRYAEALGEATDAETAKTAIGKIETVTKEAIIAGEEVIKLGRPDPVMEAKLAKDTDLEMTARNLAEQTRDAVKAISENAEVKAILTPSIENFQAAINRIQQAADDPQGPAPAKPAAEEEKKGAAESTSPAGKPEVPAAPEKKPEEEKPAPAEPRKG